MQTSSDLLDHDINLISILHSQVLGRLSLVESLTVKKESNVRDVELNIF